MNLGQTKRRSGTQDTQLRERPYRRQQAGSTSPDPGISRERPIEVNDGILSPEIRELLQPGAEVAGLEVDEEGQDGADDEYEEAENARSEYAMSMYPGAQPGYQVEHPYENGQDSATMCVVPATAAAMLLTLKC
jgi:hypothetical protein